MRRTLPALLILCLLSSPAAACVGKTLAIAAVGNPQGRLVAQVLALLVNERTGTTVKIVDFEDVEAAHKALAEGEVDIAVEGVGQALARLGLARPSDAQGALEAARAVYQERLNLVWLPPLGYDGEGGGPAAPVARKDTLKKFPALPRLIAKTEGLLPEAELAALVREGEPARAARAFLRAKKLI